MKRKSTDLLEKKKEKRVLSLSLRPKTLEDLIGQDEMVNQIRNQFRTRLPHFFIISGPVGSGKTSLARIIALCIQLGKYESLTLGSNDWDIYKKFDIVEINAANQTGVDSIRAIIEKCRFKPMLPSKAKIVILDESHMLTAAAQNCLITETEDVADHVFFIFCTSTLGKIIPALKRRATHLLPKPLNADSVKQLVSFAAQEAEWKSDITEFLTVINEHDISAPGVILACAERFFSGINAKESVVLSDSGAIDAFQLAKRVASGDWQNSASYLSQITKGDIFSVKLCVLGYLKAILLKSSGEKAINLSRAILVISESSPDDSACIASLIASICLACEHLGPKVRRIVGVKT
ncbi:P-loop containing nucleoside triphosphate hydrolase protein [Blyttiomyces helicus]|uniref:P-loop containing nucleoside triphosphate hydrolase protein n=1 Tax=Blyttiomyces helicus TaxID=388810 RepID=A0A4P9WNX5_9FUNG|nr:P-loop containing nucleoside triphosphate hydrolase protein [Blyttiomyces helicus]|eukprot:RKO94704.1 P-loop containing nucleoside triphosphate hydrolase protein [Blyttiomyces helicus]